MDYEVAGLTEVGEILGVSRQRAAQLAGSSGFPGPVADLRQEGFGGCGTSAFGLRVAGVAVAYGPVTESNTQATGTKNEKLVAPFLLPPFGSTYLEWTAFSEDGSTGVARHHGPVRQRLPEECLQF
jgi:hypothetical protein